MKNKISLTLLLTLVLVFGVLPNAFAMKHTQKLGLFSFDIPETWHWAEDSQHVIIAFPDNETVAIEVEFVPSIKMKEDDIKKTLKASCDKMIAEGIQAHQGVLKDSKEIVLSGVYARQIDFKTGSPKPLDVTYIAFMDKGFAFTITYGSDDEKMKSTLDDIVSTIKIE